MELRLPLEMSPGREATSRAVFGTWGFFRTMHVKTAPSCGLHSQGGVRRGVRASGSYQEGTGKSGCFATWKHPGGHVWNVVLRRASSQGATGRSGTPSRQSRGVDPPVEIRRVEGAQRKWCRKTSVFLSRETGMPGNFVGAHQGCQVPFRPPIPNVGLLRRCSGKGLHLAMTGYHVVFLELRRDSRVTTGNSGCLLCWPREVQSSIRVAKENWGLLSSDCRANRPHLGLCREAHVPLQGRPGSRGCIPDAPGETGIHLEWKQRTPLCSRVATGISWSSLGGLKGVKPPEAFGERSRDWPLGHAGDEGPHLRVDGGVSGWFSRGGPRMRVLTSYDGEVSEPLVGRQGSRVSMRVARGSASLLSSHGRGIWPRDVLKKVSRGLSRVEAGNPGFPRLVQVT